MVNRPTWQPKAKHAFWKAGLNLTPFVYSLVIAIWGKYIVSSMVIAGIAAIFSLFCIAGFLHFRDLGGWSSVGTYVRENLIISFSTVGILCCFTVGIAVYLYMRPPVAGKFYNRQIATESSGAASAPGSLPTVPQVGGPSGPAQKVQAGSARQREGKKPPKESPSTSPDVPSAQQSPTSHQTPLRNSPSSPQPQPGGQSVGTLNCNSAGNCAGINNGQQVFVQNGEPPSVKQMIVEVKTTCTLNDPNKVPENIVMSTASEKSYIGNGNVESENLLGGAYTFASAGRETMVATQKFSLEPTSSLIGKPTGALFQDYSLLHIVNTAVSGGYFRECTFLSVDMQVNGVNVMHFEKPVSAHMDEIHGLVFDVGLTPR